MNRTIVTVALTGLFTFALGCGAQVLVDADGDQTDGPDSPCVRGRQVSCGCSDGTTGAQTCLEDATFGPCSCDGSGPSDGAGPDDPSTGGSSLDAIASGARVHLANGGEVLIDAFPASSGVFIVLHNAVLLVNRQGETLKTLPSAREITAAAFDGQTLVIADKAKFTSYDVNLAPVTSANLLEPCASAILVSGSRFVCGPADDADRVLSTYDALSGALLASSKPYADNGVHMRRVPGRDAFVTVSRLSPSDFHFYYVRSNGEPVYTDESPYHGDFRASPAYAFDGSPAGHLITEEGLLLDIDRPGCTVERDPSKEDCLVKDGALGTLRGSERFIGMDSDDQGKVYGLVASKVGFSERDACASGCVVQRVDVAARAVEKMSDYPLAVGPMVATRHDARSNALLLGYRRAQSYSLNEPPWGYTVVLAGY